MKGTIIFIHGMFQNPVSWDKWIAYFTEKGYNCIAPPWPLHEGQPADLRDNPPTGLGELRLASIITEFYDLVKAQPEPPILIGHSVGGLVVQILINNGLGKLGVPISSVAPNAMISFDWGFIKNSAMITNPLKGDEPFLMDLQGFHDSFCNTMSMEETEIAFQRTATHDSRNVLRDCLGEDGRVDLDLPHVPLLFISGKEDQIIPTELDAKVSKAYTDEISSTEYREFPNRGHFICGEPGWEEVANYVYDWIERKAEAPAFQTTDPTKI